MEGSHGVHGFKWTRLASELPRFVALISIFRTFQQEDMQDWIRVLTSAASSPLRRPEPHKRHTITSMPPYPKHTPPPSTFLTAFSGVAVSALSLPPPPVPAQRGAKKPIACLSNSHNSRLPGTQPADRSTDGEHLYAVIPDPPASESVYVEMKAVVENEYMEMKPGADPRIQTTPCPDQMNSKEQFTWSEMAAVES